MRTILCALSLIVAITTSGCAPKTAPGTRIVLTRSPCFGMCPSYTLTISASGQVVYDGVGYHNTVGGDTTPAPMRHDTVTIAPHNAVEIFAAYDRTFSRWRANRYGPGAPACSGHGVDAPTLTIVRERGARQDTMDVEFGFWCPEAPARIERLGAYIDSVVGVQRWLGPAPGSRPAT